MGDSKTPRFMAGAGRLLQVPTQADDEALEDAYFVTPADHVGRVVTGVVFIGEGSRRDATQFLNEDKALVEQFGIASVSFADKLAEQGYKVLVLRATKAVEAESEQEIQRLEQAAAFLRTDHSIQRLALFGYGAGADLVIKVAVEKPQPFDCYVALSPEGRLTWSADGRDASTPLAPTLVLVGGKTPYAQTDACERLSKVLTHADEKHPSTFRSRVFRNQSKGFAFSGITDEDAATQAIAEVLDWLVAHLHRFRVAACTSDTDPWWPQGRNGPFFNCGLRTWQEARDAWVTPTQTRPPRPPSVPSHLIFDGLSSVRRTFDLPQRMALGDIVELFVEIWEVQQ
ncbi:hypothetical protein Poli38472_002058 [Pythium oligandrum]|uniref:Dienelactone hydrolase domain-containing protein n=1 Tax=Pythium oligandrum TaxID=41045 RepID=A0A8K1CJ36_PYTOL|nr:hypothetical protein Poli38472_002058 [Pythium oligandrum]|eukprot:TMW63117.1 hypothetical protein Poli38472_002058 [Pythium oligandrum]